MACILVCTCALAWPQSADEETARTRILALEHAWNQAEENNDVRSLDSLFDNGMVYVDSDGALMTKAEFLARAKSARLQKVVTLSMSVMMFGSTAIVTGIYEAKIFKDGKLKFERGRFVDTWLLRNSTWRCIAAQSTPMVH